MECKNSRKKLKQLARQQRAWELRLQHWSQPEIAKELNCSQAQISKDLAAAGEIYRQQLAVEAKTFTESMVAQIDMYLRSLHKTMYDAEGNLTDPKSLNIAIKFLTQRAKLLGLDRQQVEIITSLSQPEEVKSQLEDALKARGSALPFMSISEN